MKDKEYSELCAEMIELVTKKLLDYNKNESQTLKIVKIGVQRAVEYNKK